MLRKVVRFVTPEMARRRILEEQLKAWLRKQLLAPAPGRPRNVVLGEGTSFERTCHVNPCATTVRGVEYIDLDVRDEQGGKVIVTIRLSATHGRYVETLWR